MQSIRYYCAKYFEFYQYLNKTIKYMKIWCVCSFYFTERMDYIKNVGAWKSQSIPYSSQPYSSVITPQWRKNRNVSLLGGIIYSRPMWNHKQSSNVISPNNTFLFFHCVILFYYRRLPRIRDILKFSNMIFWNFEMFKISTLACSFLKRNKRRPRNFNCC